MKKQYTSIRGHLLLYAAFFILNGCVSSTPESIVPHINLSPENIQLAADSDKRLDFGMEVESNESDSLDNLEVLPGIRIRSVMPAGAAENAGLKRGDVILSINDMPTNHPDTLATIFETDDAGRFLFTVRRDTTVFEVTLTAPKATITAEPKERYRADPLKTRAGYRTELLLLDGDGTTKRVVARIAQLWPDSPLPEAGIEVGDAVVAVGNNSIESAQDLITRLSNNYDYGQEVVFSILKKDSAVPFDRKVTLWDSGRKMTKFNIWPLFTYKSDRDSGKTKFKFMVWVFDVFSVFSYERDESERSYRILEFIRFQSDNRGELIDATNTSGPKP